MGTFRTERDSMGEMQVPESAYYGAQTQRAVENFPISGLVFSRALIAALGIIKGAAAKVNQELGLLDEQRAKLIIQAAAEVENGALDEHFVVDIFQTGSGTSSNMNANEVIANRAKELGGADVNIHPNDHVNMGQSSNDVIPTAIHIATALEIENKLLPGLNKLAGSLGKKEREFADIVKTGRTHLQDATPISLGQEFSGYRAQIEYGIVRAQGGQTGVLELPLGGTAVGTGLNTPAEFPQRAIREISAKTGLEFFEARNHFEAHGSRDALVELSGGLKTIACSLAKLGNDIRWLGSGPRCGLTEILLPEVQPGSSIMPGKVNPVIAESLLMVVAQVIGNDTAVTISGHSGGNFELNVMMPVMAHNILESVNLLATSTNNFAERCVDGLRANEERLHQYAEMSTATCTALAPHIGYDQAAKLAKEAFEKGVSIRELAKSKNLMSDEDIDRILDLSSMTRPGVK